MTTTAMERKATAFLSQFSATLFAQWTSESAAPLFWRDAARVREILEEGVAKLPAIPLKGHLRRELSSAVAALQAQLDALHKDHIAAAAPTARDAAVALLSEQDVEPVLSTLVAEQQSAEPDRPLRRQRVTGVLALDDDAVADAVAAQLRRADSASTRELLELVEQCVTRVRVLTARGAERSVDALRGKSAFFLHHIARGAEALTRAWLARSSRRGAWCCDADTPAGRERERLRHALSAVLALAGGAAPTLRSTPFYRPEESARFRSLRYEDELAAVHGALLALAVAFPLVPEDGDDEEEEEEDDDDDTSAESSDDEHENRERNTHKAATRAKIADCEVLAQQVTRQIVLASGSAPRRQDWFLAVLSAFHRFPRPSQYVDEEEEEDDDDEEAESALSAAQRTALDECLTDLYRRAFATAAPWASLPGDAALVRAVLCLRHAATRVRATQTALSTALSTLVAVPLPPSFWRWMWHVKRVYAGEHAVVQRVMKTLTKNKSVKKMANVLLQDSVLSLEDLEVVVQHYELFLVKDHEQQHFVVASSRAVTAEDPADADDGEQRLAGDATLFFVDNAGGQQKKKTKAAAASPARPAKRARS
ncbi:hypothetical protein P43SY_008413 [Pythium insidiosum]|uniref:Uncharacterized protein n=1 Tax=Pythium insidiosum TaxID=114742 RepID=A0AAD5LTT9_PYTIN|nr:hypothetical protein P43SY_008413 [Pythium insidiosum]